MERKLLAAALAAAFLLPGGCDKGTVAPHTAPPDPATEMKPKWERQRRRMVKGQMRDVKDPAVLAAMGEVPRHLFVPEGVRAAAYQDRPLRIGQGQTISQPYIVARMTEAGGVKKGSRVLEVGTGSGYQAAVLAALGCRIWSIEIVEALHRQAATNLREAGYDREVTLRHGDGYGGWAEAAPFDAILVTAAPEQVPEPLKQQLALGGRLVIPVGSQLGLQKLLVITRTAKGYDEHTLFPVRFVPLTRDESDR